MKEPYENDGQIYWWDKLHHCACPGHALQSGLQEVQAISVHAEMGHFGLASISKLYTQTTLGSRTYNVPD